MLFKPGEVYENKGKNGGQTTRERTAHKILTRKTKGKNPVDGGPKTLSDSISAMDG